jgi:hypothetical protein
VVRSSSTQLGLSVPHCLSLFLALLLHPPPPPHTHTKHTSTQVRVEIESLAEGVDLSEPLTRARFEELNADLFKKTLGPVRKVGVSCVLGGTWSLLSGVSESG